MEKEVLLSFIRIFFSRLVIAVHLRYNRYLFYLLIVPILFVPSVLAGFSSDTSIVLHTYSGLPVLGEGCHSATIELSIEPVLSVPLEVNFQVSGTAQNGEDINYIPPIIRLPAGTPALSFPILAVDDGISEGPEELEIQVSIGKLVDTFSLTIVESEFFQPVLGPDLLVCLGDTLTIRDLNLADSALPLIYRWFVDGVAICDDCKELTLAPDQALLVVVEATDIAGCAARDSIHLIPAEVPVAPSNLACGTVTDTRLSIQWEPIPEALSYEVRLENGSWESTALPQYEWKGLTPGQGYDFEVRAVGKCTYSPVSTLSCHTLNCATPGFVVETSKVSCPGASDGSINITFAGRPAIQGFWLDGVFREQGVFDSLPGGHYKISIVTSSGCDFDIGAYVEEPLQIPVEVSLIDPAYCEGSADGSAVVTWQYEEYSPDSVVWDNGEKGLIAQKLSSGRHYVTLYFADFCPVRTFIDVPYADKLSLISEIYPVTCNGADDGEIAVLAYNGTAPYTYQWKGLVGSSNAIKDLVPGIYPLVVKDARGCVLRDSFLLEDPLPLEVSVEATDVSCAGYDNGNARAVVSGGRGPYAYFWSGGGLKVETDRLSAGDYYLVVQDSEGCRRRTDFEINQPERLQADINLRRPSCYGEDNGWIKVLPSGGTGEYQIRWEDDLQGAFERENLGAGIYSFDIVDENKCPFSSDVELLEPDSLEVIWEVTGETCPGNRDGRIALSVSGGTGDIFVNWQDGSTDSIRTGLPASLMRVWVSDENGCQDILGIEVTVEDSLRVDFLVREPSCKGMADGRVAAEIEGGSPPYDIKWEDGSKTAEFTGVKTGLYSLTITDSGACRATRQVRVNEPEVLELAFLPEAPSCDYSSDGRIAVLPSGGVAPYTYVYDGVERNAQLDLEGLKAGVYPLEIRDRNGCTLRDTFFLAGPASLHLSAESTVPSCYNATDGIWELELSGGTGSYDVTWLGPDGSILYGQSLDGAGRGWYEVQVRDENDCLLEDSLYLDAPPLLEVSMQMAQAVKEFISYQPVISSKGGTGLHTFLWYWGDSLFYSCTNCLPPVLIPTTQSQLRLEVYDENGCFAEVGQNFRILKNREFFIPNAFSPNGDGINDHFSLFGYKDIRIEVLEILDRWGNLVYRSGPFLLGEGNPLWDGNFNGKKMPAGVYLWQLKAVFPDNFIDYRKGTILLVR